MREYEDGWVFDLRYNVYGRLKNDDSIRTLPVPAEVLRLGYPMLFPDLFNTQASNDLGNRLYDILTRAREYLANSNHTVPEWGRMVHALRGSMMKHLKQNGTEEAVRRDIAGHKPLGTNEEHYVERLSAAAMRPIIDGLPSMTSHLTATPLQLMPWIARKEAPPWEGRGNKERV